MSENERDRKKGNLFMRNKNESEREASKSESWKKRHFKDKKKQVWMIVSNTNDAKKGIGYA